MLRALALVGLLVLLGAVTAAIPDIRAVVASAWDRDSDAVRADLDALGAWAAVVLVLFVVLHNVVPVPAELLLGAAGYALGVAVGLPVMVLAWWLSAVVGYGLAEAAGRPLALRFVGVERVERLERLVARGGSRTLLLLRLIPLLPFTGVSVVCGLARVPLWQFSWTSVVGFLPMTALCVVLGARLQEPSLTDPVLWGTLGGVVLLVVAGPRLLRVLSPR